MDRATFERVQRAARDRAGSSCSVTRSTASSSTIRRDRLPAACELDERAVSLGSISKSYGLPGLRLGWLVTPRRHDYAGGDAS